MLARNRKIPHPHVGEIDLPLLVPSFSSKGFCFTPIGTGKRKRHISEVAWILEQSSSWNSPALLVSAYDIHFKHLLVKNSKAWLPRMLSGTQLIIVDSGGYELSPDFDSTEPKAFSHTIKNGYDARAYKEVLDALNELDPALPLLISNFDYGNNGKSIQEQVSEARELFDPYRSVLTSLIIKPTARNAFLAVEGFSDRDFANLRGFDVIGVTEKDLGSSIWDRLRKVARLRRGLDEAGIDSPLHVWGGLDPVITPLFFFAGASIFDGVSWLRYVFREGVATCRESSPILLKEIGVTAHKSFAVTHTAMRNIRYLDNLAISLQQWVDLEGQSFDMFGSIANEIETAYTAMVTRIPELKGGA